MNKELTTAEKINEIIDFLNISDDSSMDYLPPPLKELRSHIFQIHALYERSLEVLLYRDYLETAVPYDSLELLFERLSFYDKQKIVHSACPSFPNSASTKINELRNVFAHKNGDVLRKKYSTDQSGLIAYQLLRDAYDKLNDFWASRPLPIYRNQVAS